MSKSKRRQHRFKSIEELRKYFSEYLSLEEMEIILLDGTKAVKHLEGERTEKAHLEFIQSCAEAMEMASDLKMMGL